MSIDLNMEDQNNENEKELEEEHPITEALSTLGWVEEKDETPEEVQEIDDSDEKINFLNEEIKRLNELYALSEHAEREGIENLSPSSQTVRTSLIKPCQTLHQLLSQYEKTKYT